MKNLDLIGEELFNKIRGRFPSVTIGTDEGIVTNVPNEARFFDFDFTEGAKKLGKVSISIDEKSLNVMYSNNFIEGQDKFTKEKWYGFLKELRYFAKKRLLNFDTRDITKSNLNRRDYKFLANTSGEQTMSESKMYGTSKTSYQDLGNARLAVKHSKPVNQELAAGRTQHIEAIYIESDQGERFKYPFRHLNGARAMARHVAEGGNAYDDFGKHIVSLSEELAKLRKFKNYMGRSSVMAEGLSDYMDAVYERIETVKKTVEQLQKESYYKEAFENYTVPVMEDVPEELASNWIDQLTIKQFNEELKDVFPYIYKLVNEKTKAKELGPEDLLGESHYPHEDNFQELYGIDDIALYKEMADDAQDMEMHEFHDTYSSVIDMADEFWEDHQDEDMLDTDESMNMEDDKTDQSPMVSMSIPKVTSDMAQKLERIAKEKDIEYSRQGRTVALKGKRIDMTMLRTKMGLAQTNLQMVPVEESVAEDYKLNDADKKVMQKLTGMIKQKQEEFKDARKGGYDEDVRMISNQLEDFYAIAELIQGKRPMGLDTSVMDLVHDMYDEVGAKFDEADDLANIDYDEVIDPEASFETHLDNIITSAKHEQEPGMTAEEQAFEDFKMAAANAAAKGEKEFEYPKGSGKKHPVKMDKGTAAKLLADNIQTNEDQLNEWGFLIPLAISAASTVGRIAGPRLLTGAKELLKWSAKNPVKATIGGVAVTNPQDTANVVGGAVDVVSGAGDAVNSIKQSVASAGKTVIQTADDLKAMAGGALDKIPNLEGAAAIAKQYALPAALVMAILFGGYKAYKALFGDDKDDKQMAGTDSDAEMDKKDDVPLEEFVKSMYDYTNNRFPKGETAVMTAVQKKYGDQSVGDAQEVMVELLKGQDEEMARIQHLAGLR